MGALSTFRNLASGRVPPVTRTALFCGGGIFLLTLLVFQPGAGGLDPAQPLANGVRLVSPDDARTESVILLDTSAVYFPSRSALGGLGRTEVGQPEDAPFARSVPVLQFDPTKSPSNDSTLQLPRSETPPPAKAVPLAEVSPFTTFGTAGYGGQGIAERAAFFEVFFIGGGKKSIISGKIPHFNNRNGVRDDLLIKNAPFLSTFEVILSVDSLGKTPLGAAVRLSGSKPLDEAIRRWATDTDWSAQLPPGTYRLIVGP